MHCGSCHSKEYQTAWSQQSCMHCQLLTVLWDGLCNHMVMHTSFCKSVGVQPSSGRVVSCSKVYAIGSVDADVRFGRIATVCMHRHWLFCTRRSITWAQSSHSGCWCSPIFACWTTAQVRFCAIRLHLCVASHAVHPFQICAKLMT